ncbi:probable PHO8-repressible alkaline phosphatase vacuolar [Sporisorium reilianum f. sp. reilianum]|uniref:Alkaline phosphatase n=1 Tax=Sporisorium reilianum f. sp. reilianum TaxID=72559 RepID=A0A2N8UHB2_9BASI|nr:probable PHO8-repressible alkaline phosphatase vacuolar [Sporisorium reilianum f. sp. reilianum]
MQLQGIFVQLGATMLLALTVSAAPNTRRNNGGKKQPNVIQLISDGFGPASETFAREFMQTAQHKGWNVTLPLDKLLVGEVRTRSTNSLVTDSAASATAYSCGLKSVNAYIGVDSDKKPCGTVLEGAKAKGYNTALVTTSRITHATPASYSAHVDDRDAEDEIASQQIGNYMLGRQADILWGGGLRHFLPNTTKPGIRTDGRNLVNEAKQRGFNVVSNRTDFDALQGGNNLKLPSMALFTSSHMAYEIDRNATLEPSLKEMALTALTGLRNQDEPYFIMIEGARIDHAAHNNDPIGHIHDILAYQEMVQAVVEWVDSNAANNANEPETVIFSVADHECGGLTLGLQRSEDEEGFYGWYPDVLLNATRSTEFLASQTAKWVAAANRTDADLSSYIKTEIVGKGLGIADVQDGEVQRAVELSKLKNQIPYTVWLSSIVNWRAHLGWSTTGHSGVSVGLYYHEAKPKDVWSEAYKSYSQRRASVIGSHENTWIGKWIANYLQLDLASITKTLNNGSDYSWYNNWGDKLNVFTDKLEHYHGGLARVIPPRSASEKRDLHIDSHAENEPLMRRIHGPRVAAASIEERSHSAAARREEL